MLLRLLQGSKFLPQLHLVLLDGIALGGFNVVDLPRLAAQPERPCLAVMRRPPDLRAVETALRRLPRASTRLELLGRAGPIHRTGGFVFQEDRGAAGGRRCCYHSLMCRLFGQHAHPGFDTCEPLCSAENALRFQSHRHPHGWGIGWYEDGTPHVRRGILPAHSDDTFLEAGKQVRSRLVVAHVREASVGPVRHENTHPFLHDRWLFAHNGTVARYKDSLDVRTALAAEIDPDLRLSLRGDTDSERCFYLFLTRLRARARAGLAAPSLEDVRRALAETMATVLRIADAVPAPKPSSLTFLVSDGRLLAACRHRRTLQLSADAGQRHAIVVASERIGRNSWTEIPEGGFVGTDDGVRAVTCPLAA